MASASRRQVSYMAAVGMVCSLAVAAILLRIPEALPSLPVASLTVLPAKTAGPASAALPAEVVPVAGRQPWRPVRRSGQPLTLLDKQWFVIGYDEARKNPAWVTYDLAGPITSTGPEPTRPVFATDFATAAHVNQRDYSGSGYDRGHLCPAFAMWSRHGSAAFMATFICSNIVPQPHPINAGIWEDLEILIAGRNAPRVASWAERFTAVTVINGPLYAPETERLRTGISIPAACFSVVIRRQPSGMDLLAFEIPNRGEARGPLTRYLVSVQQVEAHSGLDLFAGQPPEIEPLRRKPPASALWN
jgi:endonuclease G